jgi:hypothetical protein
MDASRRLPLLQTQGDCSRCVQTASVDLTIRAKALEIIHIYGGT